MKNKFTVPRRGVWYIFKLALIILVVIVLAYGVFVTAMNVANAYILANEGMAYRASCILGDGDPNELYAYFTEECIENDELLSSNIYQLYTISSYDYRLTTVGIGALPWYSTLTVEVIERVPTIVGTANLGAPTSAVPLWTAGRYRLALVREGSRFLIDDIELLEENPPEEERPTPDMSISPIPAVTPTPDDASPDPSLTATPAQTIDPSASLEPTQSSETAEP